jgi:putative ABC transport system substrate-binding protein
MLARFGVVLTILSSGMTAAMADVAAGSAAFTKWCSPCHSAGDGARKIGGPLNGLDGRKSASVEGFTYSDALKGSKITWNEAQFNEFVNAPRQKVPGTLMLFLGLKDAKVRSDLWAEDHYDRLPALAEELVRDQVAMIAATGNARLALTAKAATQTIPIVFVIGADPITTGLITSLARPGGNITGFTLLAGELFGIRLDLLHKLIPAATSIGYLWNPANYNPNTVRNDIVPPIFEIAARVLGVRLLAVGASNQSDIEEAFASLVQQRAGALLLTADPLFISHRDLIVALAARHAIPTIYFRHEFVPAGGLMSYDSNQADVYRRAGVYAGRILKGEKPADLPVQQPTKFELVINLKTAKTLGIEVPPTLLAIADEVIE